MEKCIKFWLVITITMLCVLSTGVTSAKVVTSDGLPTDLQGDLYATIKTTAGDWQFKLLYNVAPASVNNFVELANRHYYDGMIVYRIDKKIPAAYGGDHLENGQGNCGYVISDEFSNGMRNELGSLALDNNGPNSAGGRWFVNLADNPQRNGKYTVFGIYEGDKKVLEALLNKDVDSDDVPVVPITIKQVVIWQ